MTKTNTWDKWETETPRAYAAFLHYKKMGALRSLRNAAADFYKERKTSNLTQMEKWSNRFKWVSRCNDFDIEEDKLQTEQNRKDVAKMNARQAKDGMEMSKIGMYNIKLHATDDPPKDKHNKIITPKISVPESIKLVVEGVKMERLTRGEATKIKEHKGELGMIYEGTVSLRTDKKVLAAANQLAEALSKDNV